MRKAIEPRERFHSAGKPFKSIWPCAGSSTCRDHTSLLPSNLKKRLRHCPTISDRLPSHPATPGSYWLHPVVKDLHTYPIKYIAANSLPRKVSPEFLWSSPRISSASCGAESCYRRRGNHDPGKCRQNGKEAALVLIRRMHANHSHATPVDGSDTSSRGGNRDGSSSDGDGGGGGGGGRRVVDVYVPWALRQPPCTVTVRYLTGGCLFTASR